MNPALRRDLRLAARQEKPLQALFRRERQAVTAALEDGEDPALAVSQELWERALGDLWVGVGEVVYPQHVDQLVGEAEKASYRRQLIALIQQMVRRGAPAAQVQLFVQQAAEGITSTSRRRIHTVLGELGTPSQIRPVVRALTRLYNTEFVADRAARIALDQTLRAAQVFEQAAVESVAVSTGREYVKVWRTQGDDRVRSSHSDAAGQTVPMAQLFTVGGAQLLYPRDPAGPMRETAGCRCWAQHRRV